VNKIVLLNVRELHTEEDIKPQNDYGIFLVAQRISEELEDQDSDDKQVKKFRLKVERIDSVVDLKTGINLKVEKGSSPSQKQRFSIERELGKDEYDAFMAYLITKIPQLCDEYKDR